MNRPQGITILSWIAIVGGAFEVIAAILGVLAFVAAIAIGSAAALGGAYGGGGALALAGIFALISAIFVGALGLVAIAFGVGGLGLKPWAWSLGVIWCYIAAVYDVVSIFGSRGAGIVGALISAIIGIAVAVGVLYYLFRPTVKEAFGKGSEEPPSFILPVFAQIDTMVASNRQGPRPAAPGGYNPPPQGPAPYQPPQAPDPNAGYQPPAPPSAPTPPAPPAPPA